MAVRYYSSTSGEMTLQGAVTASDTSVTVSSTAGLPVLYPYVIIVDYGTANEEILDVTAASGVTLTVVRGRDGSVAQTHALGAKIRHAMTARDLKDSRDHENASSAVHGLNGAVVGTTDQQTLDRKVFQPQADRVAAIFRRRTGNTLNLFEIQDAAANVVGYLTENSLRFVEAANDWLKIDHGPLPNTTKDVLTTWLRSDVNAITGRIAAGASGRFLRLMSGATEVFSVAANGDVKATDVDAALVTASNVNAGIINATTVSAPNLLTQPSGIEREVRLVTNAGGTTDASGYITLTHAAGFTPRAITAYNTSGGTSAGHPVTVDNITLTQARFRFANWQTGGALVSAGTGPLMFVCWS
ncbi:MAG: hypothetical protein ACRCSN_19715 [Dermatophilaceae bacterium]